MRRKGSSEELERRRYRAMQLLGDGYDAGEVARRVGVDRRSVRRWKAAYRMGGNQALKARAVSGFFAPQVVRTICLVLQPFDPP